MINLDQVENVLVLVDRIVNGAPAPRRRAKRVTPKREKKTRTVVGKVVSRG